MPIGVCEPTFPELATTSALGAAQRPWDSPWLAAVECDYCRMCHYALAVDMYPYHHSTLLTTPGILEVFNWESPHG